MAQPVSEMPSRKYPWEEWLDGRVWELVPGEDFVVTIASFLSLAHWQAKRRGVSLTTRSKNGKLYIQASGKKRKKRQW